MPKAKRLPSGSYRCRATWTETVDGKKVRRSKSFTAADRRTAERDAALYEQDMQDTTITVSRALDNFIATRKKTVSPTTLRAYKCNRDNSFGMIEHALVKDVDSLMIQDWINDFKKEHSPKTVKNNYALLQSALQMARPSLQLRVILPDPRGPELETPTDEDIKQLLGAFKDTEMEKAILLAAFGTLRRSEICALTKNDIRGDSVTVSKALVYSGSDYVVKSPKTASSVRTVQMPAKVIQTLVSGLSAPTERVVSLNPNQISNRFRRKVKSLGLSHIRFHDLRAYAASIRHAMGIPDQYIMMDGGWKTDSVLKRVYRRTLEDKRKEFSKISNKHFEELLS